MAKDATSGVAALLEELETMRREAETMRKQLEASRSARAVCDNSSSEPRDS
jgi:hypothetical protein